MKVYSDGIIRLTPMIESSLAKLRRSRNFNAKKWIDAKAQVLNDYFNKNGLDTAVVAVSGGVDSALVVSLVKRSSLQKNSPIKRIIAITLPVKDSKSATNQTQSIDKAIELCKALEIDVHNIDTTKSYEQIYPQVESALGQERIDDWARGQLCAYARTPIIYYTTSVAVSQGFKPVVVGTTNRDEGTYLGYVGKASDAMVDIQLISDLHKSEVFSCARHLAVPESILNSQPNGDMFDGRSDECVFGTTYDAVEFYLCFKDLTCAQKDALMIDWSPEDYSVFEAASATIEKLHKYNAHKYSVGSPAVHLDILPSAVEGGWIEGIQAGIHKQKAPLAQIINTSQFVGWCPGEPEFSPAQLKDGWARIDNKKCVQYEIPKTQHPLIVTDVLSLSEVQTTLAWLEQRSERAVQVNEYGQLTNKGQLNRGSRRITFYSHNWANLIKDRLLMSGGLEPFIYFEHESKSNHNDAKVWKLVGVNPLMRVLNYGHGNDLVAHYDDSYIQNKNTKSLKTIVIVLQAARSGGETRFLHDAQDSLPIQSRDFSDWDRTARGDEVMHRLKPLQGQAMVFEHRVLHDGARVDVGEKILLRTEAMFERCEL